MRTLILIAICLCFATLQLPGQTASKGEHDSLAAPPALLMVRAEEDYSYLRDQENRTVRSGFFDPIKFIPLSRNRKVYLSFGGQIRPRFELFKNRFWASNADQRFYSQRLALHANVVLGKHVRVFGELYHGLTSHEQEFAGYDLVDVFQAFAEYKFSIRKSHKISVRVGRQEMGLGATRLLGIREGPNIRRSYDLVRGIARHKSTTLQAFYGREVLPMAGAFDNRFTFFDPDGPNPRLWGLYSQFKIRRLNGMNEVYYLGFQVANSTYTDLSGEENRHTFGLRRFGRIGKHWTYNTEGSVMLTLLARNDSDSNA
ncbi:MAG: alginate export family protein [Bacteroidota bacterium]